MADKPFAKTLKILEVSVVYNYLWGKLLLVSLLDLSNAFDIRFMVNGVPLFIPDLNLLSCKIWQFYISSAIVSHFILILCLSKINL